jgi:hypothetical protein
MVYMKAQGYPGRRFRLLRVVLGGRLRLRRLFGTNDKLGYRLVVVCGCVCMSGRLLCVLLAFD